MVNYVQEQIIMERNIIDRSSVLSESLSCPNQPTNHPNPLPSFVNLVRLSFALLQQTKEEKNKGDEISDGCSVK